ncbi:MAG: hypothetical protein KDD69_16025 [Bdellovibrionales bacterium]|nr:hypothetical protein [Bdellovibrionales bacterium]
MLDWISKCRSDSDGGFPYVTDLCGVFLTNYINPLVVTCNDFEEPEAHEWTEDDLETLDPLISERLCSVFFSNLKKYGSFPPELRAYCESGFILAEAGSPEGTLLGLLENPRNDPLANCYKRESLYTLNGQSDRNTRSSPSK